MLSTLENLFKLVRERKEKPVDGSYTNKLLSDKSLSKSKVLEEINELIERSEAGFSVFADLSQRKLQQVELLAISIDLKGRLASFWVDYLENFSGSHLVK